MADPKNGIVVDDVADDARLALEEVKKAEPEAEPEIQAEAPVETEPKVDRARGPDGKFVKKEESAPEPKEAPVADGVKPQGDAPATPEAPQAAPASPPAIGAPPPGWTIAAKAEWDKLSPAVKEAIAKRETEVSTGFKQYEGLRPYAERAAKSGQTVASVMERFAGMEDLLRRDTEQGLAVVLQNLGKTQHEAAQIFAKLAQRYGASVEAPQEQYRAQPDAPPSFDPNAIVPHIQRVLDERLRPLEQTLNQTMTTAQAHQTRQVDSVIERFRSDPAHKYFDNLEASIAQLFEAGIVERTGDHHADLKRAYETACWQHPEIRAQLINEQNAKAEETRKQRDAEIAAKAKAAGKSITGASVPAAIIPLPGEDDVYAAARAAVRQHSL